MSNTLRIDHNNNISTTFLENIQIQKRHNNNMNETIQANYNKLKFAIIIP